MTLALAGIAKNEGMVILDWVIHHLANGFDEVLVVDDSSSDGSLELVEALGAFLPVRSLRLNVDETPKQQAAYRQALKFLACELVAFADLDEFYVGTDSQKPADVIKEVFTDDLVSGLAVNWEIAGTPRSLSSFGAPIRYPWRQSEVGFSKNHYYKSVVRRSRVQKMDVHQAELTFGLYLHVDRRTHVSGPSSEEALGVEDTYPCGGISTTVVREPLRLVHFATRGSFEEFFISRAFRRRASVNDSRAGFKANGAFWSAHNPEGPEVSAPSLAKDAFDRLFEKALMTLARETDLLSDISVDIESLETSKFGGGKIVVKISGHLKFDQVLEISIDGSVFALLPVIQPSGEQARIFEVHLPESGREFILRIPGVWTSRPRIYRRGENLVVDEIYQELTFRQTRAERLLLLERLENIQARDQMNQLKESTKRYQEELEVLRVELANSAERNIEVLTTLEGRVRALQAELDSRRLGKFFRFFGRRKRQPDLDR